MDGTAAYDTIMTSPFRSLFHLSVRLCSLSGKLLHNFLCRQIKSSNPDELWFVFGGHPIRFSLREFEVITGLPCGPYPVKSEISAATSHDKSGCPYWYTLVGPSKKITISHIVKMLQNDREMPIWRKVRLVLIVIVEGILTCGTQPIRPSSHVVEMVRNLDFFLAYPWGRHSFEMTIRMVKVGHKVKQLSKLVTKLKQRSLVLHGFPLAIQLHLFQSIPLLLRYLPDHADAQTFVDANVSALPSLKTYHTDNILHLENDPEVYYFIYKIYLFILAPLVLSLMSFTVCS